MILEVGRKEENKYIIPNALFFVKEGCICFLRNEKNDDLYRLLAAQNLLSISSLSDTPCKEEKEEKEETKNYTEISWDIRLKILP